MGKKAFKDIKVRLTLDTSALTRGVESVQAQLRSLQVQMNSISTTGVAKMQASLASLKMPTLSGRVGGGATSTTALSGAAKNLSGQLGTAAAAGVAAKASLVEVAATAGAASYAVLGLNSTAESGSIVIKGFAAATKEYSNTVKFAGITTKWNNSVLRGGLRDIFTGTNTIKGGFQKLGLATRLYARDLKLVSVAGTRFVKSGITASLHNMRAGMKGLSRDTESFGTILKGTAAIAAAFFAIAGKSLSNYDKQVKAERALLVAVKNRVGEQQRLIALASELQDKTRIGDEKTIKAEALLAKMGLQESAIKRLIPLVLDLATVQEMSLSTAADLVGKSVGSSTNALSRYGIVITGAVGSTERLDTAVVALNKQVGGQAEAAARIGMGAFVQLKNSWGDFTESLGKNLEPLMTTISTFLSKVLKGFDPGNYFKFSTKQSLTYIDKEITKYSELIGQYEERKRLTGELTTQAEDELKAAANALEYYTHIGANIRARLQSEKELTKEQEKQAVIKQSIASPKGGNNVSVGSTPDIGVLPELKTPDLVGSINDLKRYIEMYTRLRDAIQGNIVLTNEYNTAIKALQDELAKLQGNQETSAATTMMWADMVASALQQLGGVISDSFANIGQALTDSTKSMANFGSTALKSFGSFLNSLGKMLVQYGMAEIALGLGIESLKTLNGPAAIIAGGMLVGAGAALSLTGGAIKGLASNPTSAVGSATTSGSCKIPSNYDYDRNIKFRIRGQDLVAVTANYTHNNPAGR